MKRISPTPPVSQPVDSLAAAMRALIDREFIRSQRYKDQQMRANREGAHPDILEFERRLVTRMRKTAVPLFCHACVRGKSEQDALYVQGVSRARGGQSAHNFGMAVDVIHGTKAWNLHRQSWALLGHIGKEIALQSGIAVTWGGDWKFYDPAHWELREWKSLAGK